VALDALYLTFPFFFFPFRIAIDVALMRVKGCVGLVLCAVGCSSNVITVVEVGYTAHLRIPWLHMYVPCVVTWVYSTEQSICVPGISIGNAVRGRTANFVNASAIGRSHGQAREHARRPEYMNALLCRMTFCP